MEALFTSTARVEMLKLLFLRSSERHYLREIAKLTDQPVRAVQRELARLERGGLLRSELDGNRKYFRANRQSPVFPELRSLLVKTVGLGEALQDRLATQADEIEFALIFGSFASGEEGPGSDLDLLVVGSISSREVARLLAPLKEELRRAINPVIMEPFEFSERAEEEDPFVHSIIQEPKIFLKGGFDELEALAARRSAERASNES